jgi:Fungal Zn(2)-Cys(6) binuclear cluster domain/Fungal specific transcription factor domain
MPPKLSHRKSRTGCQRCKARKVKCDEARPACRNCERHGVKCDYKIPSISTKQKSAPSTDDEDITLDPNQRRLLELQLLHHFTSVVCKTFPVANQQLWLTVYTEYAIELCFENPVLLNSILSISALHMLRSAGLQTDYTVPAYRSHCPPATSNGFSLLGPIDANIAHRIYLNAAVRQQREAVSNLSQRNVDALFIATILLSYQTLAFRRLEADAGEPEVYTPPVHWLRMAKAIRYLAHNLAPAGQPATQSPFIRFLAAGTPDFSNDEALFAPEHVRPFESLLDFAKFPEPDADSDTESTYRNTLAYIGSIYKGIQESEHTTSIFRRIVVMGILVPERFLEYVDQRRPRALAMMALFCSMTIYLDDHWMYYGMAEGELRGLQSLLPVEWLWSLAVPLDIIRSGRATLEQSKVVQQNKQVE